MKILSLFFFLFLLHSVNFAADKKFPRDSTKSFIETEKSLSDNLKTGNINEAFWNAVLKTMDNKIIKLKDFKGKYVFINFWGEWCPGCREEMPSIVTAYNKFKNRAEFVGLLKPHSLEKAEAFMSEQRINFPVVLLKKEFKDRFKFDGFPLSILIFPDGKTYLRADEVNNEFFEKNIKH